MSDRAALVPTSLGPIGAIVSEAEGPQRGALILLQGGGAPCRAGIASAWARLARELAAEGIAVLRFDFVCEGDSTMAGAKLGHDTGWRRNADLEVLRQLASWFREQIGVRELLLAGSCHGGRVAMDLAAEDADVRGSFLVVPYLSNLPPRLRADKQAARQKFLPRAGEVFDRGSTSVEEQRENVGEVEAATDTSPLEESLVDSCRRALEHGPVWILIGEGDSRKPLELQEGLGAGGEGLEVEVEPGTIIHPVMHPEVLALVGRRLRERVSAAVGATVT